jgi:hypothetical protein
MSYMSFAPRESVLEHILQNGKVIENSKTNIPGIDATASIMDKFCEQQKKAFGDQNDFKAKGGFAALGKVLDKGVVLVLSLWDGLRLPDKQGQEHARRRPRALRDLVGQSQGSRVSVW